MKKLKRFFLNKWNGYNLPKLIKIKPWKIEPHDTICVLAPHADDEAIGCGGLLAKYGKQCDVVLLTDGAFNASNSNIQKVREQEFSDVMKFFEVNNYTFMRAQDTRLIEAYDLFKKIDFSSYSYVVMPHPLDSHKDHVVPQAFFKRLKNEKKIKAKAVYYEVWGAMSSPTNYIDISDVSDKKRQSIDMYVSQRNINYADRILALNHYRGIHHSVDYEEVFIIED